MKTYVRAPLLALCATLTLMTAACDNNTEITDQPERNVEPGLEASPREEEN